VQRGPAAPPAPDVPHTLLPFSTIPPPSRRPPTGEHCARQSRQCFRTAGSAARNPFFHVDGENLRRTAFFAWPWPWQARQIAPAQPESRREARAPPVRAAPTELLDVRSFGCSAPRFICDSIRTILSPPLRSHLHARWPLEEKPLGPAPSNTFCRSCLSAHRREISEIPRAEIPGAFSFPRCSPLRRPQIRLRPAPHRAEQTRLAARVSPRSRAPAVQTTRPPELPARRRSTRFPANCPFRQKHCCGPLPFKNRSKSVRLFPWRLTATPSPLAWRFLGAIEFR